MQLLFGTHDSSVSPGAGIAALQTVTAMRRGVLIPYQQQKGEIPKTNAASKSAVQSSAIDSASRLVPSENWSSSLVLPTQ